MASVAGFRSSSSLGWDLGITTASHHHLRSSLSPPLTSIDPAQPILHCPSSPPLGISFDGLRHRDLHRCWLVTISGVLHHRWLVTHRPDLRERERETSVLCSEFWIHEGKKVKSSLKKGFKGKEKTCWLFMEETLKNGTGSSFPQKYFLDREAQNYIWPIDLSEPKATRSPPPSVRPKETGPSPKPPSWTFSFARLLCSPKLNLLGWLLHFAHAQPHPDPDSASSSDLSDHRGPALRSPADYHNQCRSVHKDFSPTLLLLLKGCKGKIFKFGLGQPNCRGWPPKGTNKTLGKKVGVTAMGGRSKAIVVGQHDIEAFKSGGALSEKKKGKLLRKKKRNRDRMNESEIGKVDFEEDALHEQNGEHRQGKKKEDGKLRKKGRRTEKTKKAGIDKVSVLRDEVEEVSNEENGQSRKARRIKKGHLSSKKEEKVLEMSEPAPDEVYEISSGDEDCSRGMRKWITEYHQSRPGLETLQQRVDDFMTAYEEQQEQARKEQEALAAEGGWTVVVHHKGRKKTTETESGIAVGSVAQAAVLEREAKKKSKTKDVGVDFYRFQKREAQRSEIMALQSKFEQDKKRIQQLRAARKFRPY